MTELAGSSAQTCSACGARGPALASERGQAHSNVRAFRHESFALWRCSYCASIHASDAVDLAHYYTGYPFFGLPDDWRLRVLYDQQLRRLRRAGARPEHRILDYGCGAGAFVRHLRQRGFESAVGYDRYSAAFNQPSTLTERYDCVISQDVLEHVPDPDAFLDELSELTRPGGVIALGTPNAEAIELERHVHALHVPYHRHIFSKRALLAAGSKRGWQLLSYYPNQYANTMVPFLNSRFYLHYMQSCDGSLDCLLEGPRLLPLLARLPLSLFWGFFGYFFAEETDVMIVFRR